MESRGDRRTRGEVERKKYRMTRNLISVHRKIFESERMAKRIDIDACLEGVFPGYIGRGIRDDALAALLRVDESTACPDFARVFEAFRRVRPRDVRVVIVGQDPYPRKSDACGVAFQSLVAVPRSARIIFDNLVKYGHITAEHAEGLRIADLRGWLAQGVLMTNLSLTVEVGSPNSHKAIWSGIVQRMLAAVPVDSVLLTLGSESARIEAPCHHRIAHVHPSIDSELFGMVDCFRAVNNRLVDMGIPAIDWSHHELAA